MKWPWVLKALLPEPSMTLPTPSGTSIVSFTLKICIKMSFALRYMRGSNFYQMVSIKIASIRLFLNWISLKQISLNILTCIITLSLNCHCSICLSPSIDFLGRTEVPVATIKKELEHKGPSTRRLLLHEVPTGEVWVRLDLQLFDHKAPKWREKITLQNGISSTASHH